MLAGSFANQTGLNGTDGDIIIPLNNTSRGQYTTDIKNVTYLDFASSGQDISFFIVGANVVLANIDEASSDIFTVDIYVDDERVAREVSSMLSFGTIQVNLATPISVNSNVFVVLRTDNTSFDIVSSNWLFYSTGNIIPPNVCEFFEFVNATNGGAVLSVLSPLIGAFRETPLIYQGIAWRGGTAGNRVPRIRNWSSLSSDSTATLIEGETYYVELTLSQPYGTNNKIFMYFGYNINSRTSTVGIPYFDGDLTTPQGMYLEWNPNIEADPLFMFIGESLSVANAYNGTLTFKVGTTACISPIACQNYNIFAKTGGNSQLNLGAVVDNACIIVVTNATQQRQITISVEDMLGNTPLAGQTYFMEIEYDFTCPTPLSALGFLALGDTTVSGGGTLINLDFQTPNTPITQYVRWGTYATSNATMFLQMPIFSGTVSGQISIKVGTAGCSV
jgi:hypothetical protein